MLSKNLNLQSLYRLEVSSENRIKTITKIQMKHALYYYNGEMGISHSIFQLDWDSKHQADRFKKKIKCYEALSCKIGNMIYIAITHYTIKYADATAKQKLLQNLCR